MATDISTSAIIPADYDLPVKFKEFRPGQFQLAARIAASKKYAYLLDAPTGIGKSLIAATAQRIYGKNVIYICTTKQLQDQILGDFPYARTLKGRNNYPCAKAPKMFPNLNAEMCTDSDEHPCNVKDDCPYLLAKAEALAAPLAVLNSSYFLSEANYVGAFSGRSFVVIDEADTMEDQLMSFIELVVTKRQLDRYGLPSPKFKTKPEAWLEWAKESLNVMVPVMLSLEEQSQREDWGGVDYKVLRELKYVERLVAKLRYFVREVDNTWVWYPSEEEWAFKPIWVSKYAEGVLWKHMDKVLMMSATLLDPKQICVNTGVLNKVGRTYDYTQIDSPFPVEHRPVYYEPCANVVNKEMDKALPRLAAKLIDVMNKYPDEKMLVHTVTYKIRDYLMKNINTDRFITHASMDRADKLTEFKKSSYPLVLLSPSMDRGVDLPGEECGPIVICKLPYPDLGDAQIARRVYGSADGNKWYAHKTVSKVIQMSGRAVRSVDDYGECVTPGTRILTQSLSWVPAGSLHVDDGLLCFDDFPTEGATGKLKRFRHWRQGHVVATGVSKRLCLRLHLADGTVLVSTLSHKWMAQVLNSTIWKETTSIDIGDLLLKYVKPWEVGGSYVHGWMSAFADSEGCYSCGLGQRNPGVGHITLTQNPGKVMEQAKLHLRTLGFEYGPPDKDNNRTHIDIDGGVAEKLRFLGEVRPVRLLDKFIGSDFSSLLQAIEAVPVVDIEDVGLQDIVTLQVDIGTYFAEGYGAHNTYILDAQFDRLYREHKGLFPKWFRDAIVM